MVDYRMLSQEKALELVRCKMMTPEEAARACRVLPHIIRHRLGEKVTGDIKYTFDEIKYYLCWMPVGQRTKGNVAWLSKK